MTQSVMKHRGDKAIYELRTRTLFGIASSRVREIRYEIERASTTAVTIHPVAAQWDKLNVSRFLVISL